MQNTWCELGHGAYRYAATVVRSLSGRDIEQLAADAVAIAYCESLETDKPLRQLLIRAARRVVRLQRRRDRRQVVLTDLAQPTVADSGRVDRVIDRLDGRLQEVARAASADGSCRGVSRATGIPFETVRRDIRVLRRHEAIVDLLHARQIERALAD
jgi:DNA-directed RNA polymerase specialized sigma24 family protein